ncbi:MAG: pyrroloquinoline quinone-dependent dehydrogenase [Saprospiraceae bacterium]|nr:PQQ-binding-like beta-propeller repeat protein [Lewinella sp.]
MKRIVNALLLILLMGACSPEEDLSHAWPVYKSDPESTSYSPLDQINRSNVVQLEVAWTYQHDDVPTGTHYGKYECNPIIVDDVLYATSSRSWLYAIDACTGEKRWAFDPFDGERGGGMKRGVTYWRSGSDGRILFTAGHYLFAVDAQTGRPIPTFGTDGRINLNEDLGVDPDSVWVIPTSPGIIYEDLLILGSEVSESYGAAPGHIRAYQVQTGNLVWIFHTIPQPGEPGYETWPPDAWKYAGGANNWGGMSLDEERGIVYAPLGSPTYDFYGADRAGQNLYGNSLVALDARTGALRWHFQTVHHDLWDYDLPAPPTLVTVERNGRKIDAVSLTSKIGFLYLFDRETGEPLFPIEEQPVPPSGVAGEQAWPTQPFPLRPAPYARQDMTSEDVTNISEEARDAVRSRLQELRFEGLFTPPDPRGTLMIPGTRGGSEWGGSAYDPNSGLLIFNANESPEIMTLQTQGPETQIRGQSLYARGERYYLNYCAICHGGDRRGQLPANPALLGLATRLTPKETISKIRSGTGRMPSFDHLNQEQEEAIIAFLFDLKDKKAAPTRMTEKEAPPSYRNITAYSFFRDPEGNPAVAPPWGTLNALNISTGEYAWQIPLGNHPQWQTAGAPETGMENWGGPMLTAGGLVFIAATKDKKLRAFDKDTGARLWETTLPGPGYATPSTYTCHGRQFVVISVTGDEAAPGGSIVAFALPQGE